MNLSRTAPVHPPSVCLPQVHGLAGPGVALAGPLSIHAMQVISDSADHRGRRFLFPAVEARQSRVGEFCTDESVSPSIRVNSNRIKPNQTVQLVPQLLQYPPGNRVRGQKEPANGRSRMVVAMARNPSESNLIQPIRVERDSNGRARVATAVASNPTQSKPFPLIPGYSRLFF